jgi:hypothetical protein
VDAELPQEAQAHVADKEMSMKRPGLFLATFAFLLLTGFTLYQAGWLTPAAAGHLASSHRSALLPAAPIAEVKGPDPFASDAALRWRECQPVHWRACLLQP